MTLPVVLGVAATVLAAAASAGIAVLPTRTLDDRSLHIPSDLPGARPSLLVVGFSKAARMQTAGWWQCIAADAHLKRNIEAFQIAVLEGVPKPFLGGVVSGIRRSIPPSRHDRFLLATSESAAWKATVGFAQPDDAYVLLLKQGTIAWRGRGGCDASVLAVLRAVVDAKPAAGVP